MTAVAESVAFQSSEQQLQSGEESDSCGIQTAFSGIIGKSESMQKVFGLIDRISRSDSTIIINGETGTGKNLIARAVHDSSSRAEGPFVAVNCGAIPENLLESELFGHVKGAFTGATANKQGKFEIACGGTIFLDEIGDMSPDLQVKVLRVLEEKEFEAVGGCRTKKADVRIIAATHRDLEDLVQKGRFREDLFYRLYVIPIKLPPLRDRRSDLPLLIEHFLVQFNRKNNSAVSGISESAVAALTAYGWPGNVRELKNVMERLVVLTFNGEITIDDIPRKICGISHSESGPSVEISEDGIDLNTEVTEYEKTLILKSLEQTRWVKTKAAKLLKLNRTTLVEKIKRHNLEPVQQAFA